MQYLYGKINSRKKVINMRKRVTFTLDEEVIDRLKETSETTMIPQARIVEEAIKEYIEKLDKQRA